jgi:cyclase
MYLPRVIPVLLLQRNALVKSVGFDKHKYIGDPINAVRIFNDLKADEIVFLDIEASRAQRCISLDFVKEVGEEANMPFGVGGGIRSLHEIEQLIQCGAERVVLATEALRNPEFVEEACAQFGSSSIAVCMDVKKKFLKGKVLFSHGGTKATDWDPLRFAKRMQDAGVGELIVQSIDRDGTMTGYDIELIRAVSETVKIPVVALGGAGTKADLERAFNEGYANGLAAGSLFVFHGARRGVLINYTSASALNLTRQI